MQAAGKLRKSRSTRSAELSRARAFNSRESRAAWKIHRQFLRSRIFTFHKQLRLSSIGEILDSVCSSRALFDMHNFAETTDSLPSTRTELERHCTDKTARLVRPNFPPPVENSGPDGKLSCRSRKITVSTQSIVLGCLNRVVVRTNILGRANRGITSRHRIFHWSSGDETFRCTGGIFFPCKPCARAIRCLLYAAPAAIRLHNVCP